VAATDGTALLALEGVAASWPSAAEAAVTGLDLRLHPGSVVALTGPSGVGKTTLLMTAAGLLPARSGAVLAPGAPPAAPPGAPPGAQPGVPGTATLFVAEDGHVFDTSVLENLRVARGDATPEEARSALSAVGLDGWLHSLPRGLDTRLGTDATTVSGGERRRLLVARALLSPARVLLVDEPGEHLDPVAADAVVAALATHARSTDRAVVVATHRLAAARHADEVLLLGEPGDGGPAAVVARGRHNELLGAVTGYAWSARQEAVRESVR